MSLLDLQQEVDNWVSQHKHGYWSTHEILARITEEVGELARETNHVYGHKKKKPTEEHSDFKKELGDILFSIICFANKEKINLDDSFKSAMDKCYNRDKDRYEKK